MRKVIFFYVSLFFCLKTTAAEKPKAVVVPHADVHSFENRGNKIQGVATKPKGASQFEVWHASIVPKSSTPPHHRHETEEIFICPCSAATTSASLTERSSMSRLGSRGF